MNVYRLTEAQLRQMAPTAAEVLAWAVWRAKRAGFSDSLAYSMAGAVAARRYGVSAVEFDLTAAREVGPF